MRFEIQLLKEKISKALRKNPWTWKYYINRKPSAAFESRPLLPEQENVVSELKDKGIAFSDFNTLFPEVSFDEFAQKVYEEVALNEKKDKDIEHDLKSYFNFVLGLKPNFEQDSAWNKLASHPVFQEISDAYFEMSQTEMRYYNIWKHYATNNKSQGSQLWHRDREDFKILKIFICLEDVDEKKGPFTYAPGTHLEGTIKKEPDHFFESDGTRRTTDDMMDKLVPESNWIKALGKKGTVVFADTHGYHKGGQVKEGYRLLFTAMYVSPRCLRYYFKKA